MGIYLNGLDYYPALVRLEGGMYRAEFVDIPGCCAYGASAFEAEVNAGEALDEHVVMLRRSGRSIPEPSIGAAVSRDKGGHLAYIRRPTPDPSS